MVLAGPPSATYRLRKFLRITNPLGKISTNLYDDADRLRVTSVPALRFVLEIIQTILLAEGC